MSDKRTKIQWAALVAFIIGIPSLVFFYIGFNPKVTIKNELATPVRIYANEKYLGQVGVFGKRAFPFASKEVFPVRITWKSVRLEANDGTPIGEIIQGNELVDNYRTLTITNTSSGSFYFMPVLTNATEMTCKIYINDTLKNEQYGGLLLPHKKNVNAGYYLWVGNSNVTLYCDDGPHWWGNRNGKEGPSLKIKNPSGRADLILTP
jgi:hypothetical protein